MRRTILLLTKAAAVLAFTLLLHGPLQAASLGTSRPSARNEPVAPFFTPVCNAELIEPIRSGDADRFKIQLDAFMERVKVKGELKDGQFLALCLDSPGGDMREAIRIGALFKDWMMVVPDGAECFSACAILFMSAPARDRVFSYSDESPGRFLHHRGKLGFHRPVLDISKDFIERRVAEAKVESLTPAQIREKLREAYAEAMQLARSSYTSAVDSLRDVAFPPQHAPVGLLSGVQAETAPERLDPSLYRGTFINRSVVPGAAMPPELMLGFLTVPNEQRFYITRIEEAMSWGIEIYGIPPPPVLTANMLASACINVAARRCAHSPDGECGARTVEAGMRMAQRVLDFGKKYVQDLNRAICGEPKLRDLPGSPCGSIADTESKDTDASNLFDVAYSNYKDFPFEALALSFTLPDPSGQGTTATSREEERKREMSLFTHKRHALWPTAESASSPPESSGNMSMVSSAFELVTIDKPVCHVQARWLRIKDPQADILMNFMIDLPSDFNNAQTLIQPFALVDGKPRSQVSPRLTLRPWRMLPAGTRLSDLSGPNPWGWPAEGAEFFDDRPAGTTHVWKE